MVKVVVIVVGVVVVVLVVVGGPQFLVWGVLVIACHGSCFALLLGAGRNLFLVVQLEVFHQHRVLFL